MVSSRSHGPGRNFVRVAAVFWTILGAFSAAAQTPGFLPPTDYPAQNLNTSVASGDFDGDGNVDLAVTNFGASSLSIYFGNGDGTFAAPQQVMFSNGCEPMWATAAQIVLGDRLDLLVLCLHLDVTQVDLWVIPALKNRTFGTPMNAGPYTNNVPIAAWAGEFVINSAAVADVNGDGIADFVVVFADGLKNTGSTSVDVLIGKGDGTFRPPVQIIGGSGYWAGLAVADFNQDGKPDIAAESSPGGNSLSGSLTILLGNGDGTFTAGPTYTPTAVSIYSNILPVDVDGDGILDIVVGGILAPLKNTPASQVDVFKGKGDGTFQHINEFPLPDPVSIPLAAASFRGNGIVDLLVNGVSAQGLTSQNLILPGNGDGTFGTPIPLVLNTTSSFAIGFGAVAADLDGDGLPDLAFSTQPVNFITNPSISKDPKSFPPGNVTVMLNSGTRQGSMPQIVSGAGWDTSLTLVNLGSQSPATLNFFADPGGSPLSLPFTFPQGSLGATNGASLTETIGANALLMLDTAASSASSQVGWSQLQTAGDVNGFAIFNYPPLNWSAVVPLESRNAAKYILAFDNTGGLGTGLAIANLASAVSAHVPIVIRDDTGAKIGAATLTLAPNGHLQFMLTDRYGETLNRRGTIEFDTPSGGRISVIGLRANGPALTTLPALANVDTSGGSITHILFNGGFTNNFTLVNTGGVSGSATLSFFDNSGNPLSVPVFLPQTGENLSGTTLTKTLAAGASLLIQTVGQDGGNSTEGSAQLTATGDVSGFGIFRWTQFQQEASVPLETRNASSYVLAFDDTGGTSTGLALALVSSQAASVTLNIRDDTGALLQTQTINLSGQGHISFMLPTTYAVAVNIRGTVEFVTPVGGRISVIGLRATSTGALTTIPVLAK